MKRKFLIVLSLLIVLFFSCLPIKASPSETKTYDFTFILAYLSESKDFTILNNATVSLDYNVNETGDYKFYNVEAGTHKYIIKKEGFPTVSGTISFPGSLVDAASNPLYETLFGIKEGFLFQPQLTGYKEGVPSNKYKMNFSIKDENGEAIEGAGVLIDETEYASNNVLVEGGIYEYTVFKTGFTSHTGTIVFVKGETVEVVLTPKKPLKSPYDIHFALGYPEAETGFVLVEDASISLDYRVNAAGDYKFTDIEGGDYKYIIKKDHRPTVSGVISIPDDLTDTDSNPLVARRYGVDGLIFIPTMTGYETGDKSPVFKTTFNLKDKDNNAWTADELTIKINGAEYTSTINNLEAGIYDYAIRGISYIDGSSEYTAAEYEAKGKLNIVASETFDITMEFVRFVPVEQEYDYELVVLEDVGDITLSVVSENGRYVGGYYFGKCFVHDTETKETQVFDRGKTNDLIRTITNEGTCFGNTGDEGHSIPGYRVWGGEWTFIPGIGENEKTSLWCASNDEKLLGGYIMDTKETALWRPCVWNKDNEGVYQIELLPFPRVDFTKRLAQGSRVMDISTDKTILRGVYIPFYGPAEGHFIIWRQTENGWEYEMIGDQIIYDLETGVKNELQTLSPYTAKMSNDGKNIMTSISSYELVGSSFVILRYPIVFNIENRGNPSYEILKDASLGNISEESGVYGIQILNDGTGFASTPNLNGQYPVKGLVYDRSNVKFGTYNDWLKNKTGIDIFDGTALQYSGCPLVSAQENLFAGSYSLGINKNVTSYYIKRKIAEPKFDITFNLIANYDSGIPLEDVVMTINGIDYDLPYEYNENATGFYYLPIQLKAGTYSYSIIGHRYATGNYPEQVFEGSGSLDITQSETIDIPMNMRNNIESVNMASIGLYPNPFNERIFINNANEITKVIISSATGQKMISAGLSKENSVNTESLPKGNYIITLIDINGNQVSYKLIK